jgi:hypothetical protein
MDHRVETGEIYSRSIHDDPGKVRIDPRKISIDFRWDGRPHFPTLYCGD